MDSRVEEIPASEFGLERILPGSKRRMHLVISDLPDGSRLVLPALIARGAKSGKCLLATGAVHGDEYEGPVAIQDIFEELDPARMNGAFVGVPVLNGPAFGAATRLGAWDHLDLARTFPGSPTGSPTERIAHAFHSYLAGLPDLYLDLHSAGNVYAIKALAGYQVRPGELGAVQRRAAIAFGFEIVWGTAPLPGRSLTSAWDQGTPSLYVELRGEGRCRRDDLEAAKQGIRNLLGMLDVIKQPFPDRPPRYFLETLAEGSGHLQVDHPSPTSGLFLPEVELWERVERGQRLGHVRHLDGGVLAEVSSARDGRVLFLRTQPRVISGDGLAYVLAVPDSSG